MTAHNQAMGRIATRWSGHGLVGWRPRHLVAAPLNLSDSLPNAINRRFNGVLAKITIWSILIEPGPVLGLGFRGVETLKRN
jgi:hypothetical protein